MLLGEALSGGVMRPCTGTSRSQYPCNLGHQMKGTDMQRITAATAALLFAAAPAIAQDTAEG